MLILEILLVEALDACSVCVFWTKLVMLFWMSMSLNSLFTAALPHRGERLCNAVANRVLGHVDFPQIYGKISDWLVLIIAKSGHGRIVTGVSFPGYNTFKALFLFI